MKSLNATTFGLLVLMLCAGLASRAQQQAPLSNNEVQVGPITITQPVNGVPIAVPITSYLKVTTIQNTVQFDARIFGDLSDLQAKSGPIVDSFPVPTDNCRSYSANNPVVKIWGKELIPSGASAVLRLHGYVEDWHCLENPVPNSKVVWRNDGPFGLSIPHIETWPGNPIKNLIATQPFDVSLPASIRLVDAQTVALEIGVPTVTLGGQYSTLTNGVLSIAGIDLNQKLKQALDQAINPSLLQQGIPQDYAKLNPKISAASFVNDGGKLAVRLDTTATIPGARLTDFLSVIATKRP